MRNHRSHERDPPIIADVTPFDRPVRIVVLRDLHAVVDVAEHRRHHVVALAQMRGQLRHIEPTAQQRGAFAGAELDVAAHLGQVLRADHRADDRLFVERIAHRDALGALGEARRELGVDRLLHEDAAARGATLAVVREDHEHRGKRRDLQPRRNTAGEQRAAVRWLCRRRFGRHGVRQFAESGLFSDRY